MYNEADGEELRPMSEYEEVGSGAPSALQKPTYMPSVSPSVAPLSVAEAPTVGRRNDYRSPSGSPTTRVQAEVDVDNESCASSGDGYWNTEEGIAEDEKCDCCRWWLRAARELAFTPLFRIHVYYLLYCQMTFTVGIGYHFMLATTYRMVSHPEKDLQFFGTLSFLTLFLIFLHLSATCVYLLSRLAVSWMGFTRDSVNLLLLPNYYRTPKSAMYCRDTLLFVFELLVFILPALFAIIATIVTGDPVSSLLGYFSYAAFCGFNVVFVIIYAYFLWRSLCSKAKANRRGRHHVKEMKKMDMGSRRDRDRGDDDRSERGSKRSWRKTRRGHDDDLGSPESRPSRRRDAPSQDEDPDITSRHEEEEIAGRLKRVLWRRRRLANPEVMAEYGIDLFSIQAYPLHILIGIIWILVALVPTEISTAHIEWVAILIVVGGGSVVMVCLGVSRTKSKRVAQRQRRSTYIMLTVLSLFCIMGFIAAVTTVPGILALMIPGLIVTQFFFSRRHDLHAREDAEPGSWFLPLTSSISREENRRLDIGNPSKWIALIPCGNVIRACFSRGAFIEAETLDLNEEEKLHARLNPDFVNGIGAEELKQLEEKDGYFDFIQRPKIQPGFYGKSLAGVYSEASYSGKNSVFMTNSKGKLKLVREEYLNNRERVLVADPMVVAWYFLFFIVVLGVAYGFGKSIYKTEDYSANLEESAVSYTGEDNPMMACQFKWGTDGAMNLQDFAFLAFLSQSDDAFLRVASLQKWFIDKGRNATQGVSITGGKGVPIQYSQYTITEASGAASSVFVLQETSFGSAYVRDLDTWGDVLFYEYLACVNPFFSLWAKPFQQSLISFLGAIKGVMDVEKPYKDVSDHVKIALATTDTVFIVGHGTHGGWAHMLADKVMSDAGLAVPVIAFANPGTRMTGEKVGSVQQSAPAVSLVPKEAVLSGIDQHVGFVQDFACDSDASSLQCGSMKNVLCSVLRSCGDPYGRTFLGFSSATPTAMKCTF